MTRKDEDDMWYGIIMVVCVFIIFFVYKRMGFKRKRGEKEHRLLREKLIQETEGMEVG